MSTKIAWTNEVFNPVIGCSKVSPGCQNCYAERMACRLAHMGMRAYQEVTMPKDKDTGFDQWNGKTVLVESRFNDPLKWKKPRMIFVCSMGDLFHESVPFEWIGRVMNIMRNCRRHTFQILTKRPERMFDYFHGRHSAANLPIPNIWLGVTAENQAMADMRIPILLQIPAAVRFVSIEPMLGLVADSLVNRAGWIVVGCESGPNRRPCKQEWIQSVVDQCHDAGVPVFVKQIEVNGKVSRNMNEWPESLRVQQWPENIKKG